LGRYYHNDIWFHFPENSASLKEPLLVFIKIEKGYAFGYKEGRKMFINVIEVLISGGEGIN
jgi:hypothetical protein